MHTGLKKQIIELAKATPTVEVCGLIYANDSGPGLFPCVNIAEDPTTNFEIAADDHLSCLKQGDVIACYHSHPNGPAVFSESDLETAEEACLPFYMYDVASQSWVEHLPDSYRVSYQGRRFIWGFEDCYSTCRHWYRQELGLNLGDYDRDKTFDTTDSSAILDNFEKEGFVRFEVGQTEIRLHDGLLFDLKKRCPQHLAVFVSPQRMLHHPLNALSHIDLIDGRWVSHLKCILRHKSLINSV